MTEEEKQAARRLLDTALEFGDENEQAARDLVDVLAAFAKGDRAALRKAVKNIVEEENEP